MEIINNNKIGIYNEQDLKEIEYYLFNTKYHLMDESFTFNVESFFDAEYLQKLHIFLFSDVYGEENCKIKEGTVEKVNKILKEIEEMLLFNDTEHLGEEIYELWSYQMFLDGNTRTILCFLKVISNYYDFNITYDFNKDVTEDYFIDKIIDSIKVKKIY